VFLSPLITTATAVVASISRRAGSMPSTALHRKRERRMDTTQQLRETSRERWFQTAGISR
jgi:hypothetical protein